MCSSCTHLAHARSEGVGGEIAQEARQQHAKQKASAKGRLHCTRSRPHGIVCIKPPKSSRSRARKGGASAEGAAAHHSA
eukprot:CAMPEP_0198588828 /NCGR_PEP_ID=MMETSP1462-20131121/133602_1 /TAXON_ID=1333877 /ORGANISM="Brandtodinium nutriculum, Strain RCC3387" /LENGTH=78 /DNA_ID=CAMNT_0044320333 /DNA_START=96 /DNA_END=329 /DNA_ORIENTATION=+